MKKKRDYNLTGIIPEVKPSKDFTKNVMSAIETQNVVSKPMYRPVISVPVLYGMIGCLLTFILFAVTTGSSGADTSIPLRSTIPLPEFLSSPIALASCVSLFVLLLIERLLTRSREHV